MKENLFELTDKRCISCGEQLPLGRVKFSKSSECVNCSSEERIGAFPIIEGKTEYSKIQLVSQETARKLHKAQARKGQSPGAGMKGKAYVG